MTAVEIATVKTLRTVLAIADGALREVVDAPKDKSTRLRARQAVGLLLVGSNEVARILEGKPARALGR